MSVPSLDRSREAFAASLATRTPATRRTYATALDRFRAFLEASGIPGSATTEAFTPTALEDFYLWGIRELRLDPYSVRTYVGGIRAYMRYCERRGWLRPPCTCVAMAENLKAVMPPHRYKMPKIDDSAARLAVAMLDDPLPDDAEDRLTALRDRVIIAVLYATGMRRHELAALDVADFREDRALVRGKGGRDRLVYFDEEARHAVRAYLAARGDRERPLLIRHDRARGEPGRDGHRWRLSTMSIGNIVREAGERRGLRVRPHDFRHTKARVMLNDGAQMGEVQRVLGHESIGVTERVYAAYSAASVEAAWKRHSRPARDVVGAASRFLDT